MNTEEVQPCTLALCGDVMTGRGIDQVLSYPGDSRLYESYVADARTYRELAEQQHGSIPYPVDWQYIWGDALKVLKEPSVAARIVNLETSITESDDYCRVKGIHYRMHPRNIPCLTAAGVNACSLANNHTLDWGRAGLLDTLETLFRAGIAHAGAGRSSEEAQSPAAIQISGKAKVILFSIAATDSGVPPEWSASPGRPGLNVLKSFSATVAGELADEVARCKSGRDLAIASIHWGDNWVESIPAAHIEFAHYLIDLGFDLVHGHSAHHPLPFEIYKGHLILYGCGDFINDYEGITGYEEYRSDLAVLILPTVNCGDGRLLSLRLVPFERWRFQLQRASRESVSWLRNYFDTADRRFANGLVAEEGELILA